MSAASPADTSDVFSMSHNHHAGFGKSRITALVAYLRVGRPSGKDSMPVQLTYTGRRQTAKSLPCHIEYKSRFKRVHISLEKTISLDGKYE